MRAGLKPMFNHNVNPCVVEEYEIIMSVINPLVLLIYVHNYLLEASLSSPGGIH